MGKSVVWKACAAHNFPQFNVVPTTLVEQTSIYYYKGPHLRLYTMAFCCMRALEIVSLSISATWDVLGIQLLRVDYDKSD